MRGRRQQTKRRLKSEFVFFFSLHHDYSNSLTLSNVGELFSGWIPTLWERHPSSLEGLPRCKNLWSFPLLSSYYFPWLYCVVFSVASLYSLFTSLVSSTGFYTEGEFRKRKKISSWLIYVLHEMQNLAFSRRSRAIQKRCGARAMLLFCFAFLTFLSPSPCLVPVRRLQPRPSA